MILESTFEIGQKVDIRFDEQNQINGGYIRSITFTKSKVRYSVWLKNEQTTMFYIDSCYIYESDDKEILEFDEDNLG